MKNYILKLTSGTTYKLYEGTTLVSDTDLATLFTTAGSAYFSFDFDGGTPTATDELTITDSSDTAVITNTGLTDAIEENKNYKGTWSASATAFDTFSVLGGVAMDESQLSNLMGKIKGGSIRPLSTQDIPSGQNYISLASLNPGIYMTTESVNAKVTNVTDRNLDIGSIVIVTNISTSPTRKGILVWGNVRSGYDMYYVAYNSIQVDSSGTVLTSGAIKDNLTSTSATSILSAKQGKVLNDKILGASGAVAAWTAIGTGSSYTKRALQVTLNISETGLTIPADTWTSLGITMPTNFIPTITMLGSVTANNNGTFEAGLIRVNTDGTVEVHTSNATTDIYGSIVFPVAS